MIKSHDRSGWFGASDTKYITGNFDTKTFAAWWLTKIGVTRNTIRTKAMNAGTYYEHRILDAIGVTRKDRQIKIWRYRLRVNIDGETKKVIKEVKTHKSEIPLLHDHYWQQAQVQWFASRKPVDIVFYRVSEEEYDNFFLPIDPTRITEVSILPDPSWITETYLPRLKYLAHCWRRRLTPTEEGFRRWRV